MRIASKHLGKPFKVKCSNGVVVEGVIEQDSRQYQLYKKLGLDVFEESQRAEVKETIIPDKPKKNATKKGDSK